MHFPESDKEFQDFLIQETEQHKIYASDEVWNNIHKQLHGQKRWPALGIISFIIIACLSVTTFIFNEQKLVALPKIIPAVQAISTKPSDANNSTLLEQVFTNKTLKPLSIQHINEVPEQVLITEYSNQATTRSNTIIASNNATENDITISSNNALVKQKDTKTINENVPLISEKTVNDNDGKNEVNEEPINNIKADFSNLAEPKSEVENSNNTGYNKHSVTKTRRWNVGFYFTPSISYRRLIDVNNKSAANPPNFISTSSANFNNIDVNQVVKHRPALGLEMGISVGYKVNDRVSVKSGLQFNLRRYTIQTYGYQYEPSSITLNNGSQTATVNVISQFRTASNSGMPINISNKYYEISIPVGLDWIAIENKKVALHIAGAVQPTYVLDKNPFLITSDYKNYANGKSLMRNFNINSSIETYLQFKKNGYSWQIGPQFRYQQLPSFNNTYPIREHLFDFGMKLGITRNF